MWWGFDEPWKKSSKLTEIFKQVIHVRQTHFQLFSVPLSLQTITMHQVMGLLTLFTPFQFLIDSQNQINAFFHLLLDTFFLTLQSLLHMLPFVTQFLQGLLDIPHDDFVTTRGRHLHKKHSRPVKTASDKWSQSHILY